MPSWRRWPPPAVVSSLLIVVACVVTRLPQLVSPNLLLDGDEATLGLMARALADGRELPGVFWGQRYGFSFVEAAAGALAFTLAGTSATALKLAMLALWTTGAVALRAALAPSVGDRRATVFALVVVTMPAWAVWSMKARGGYLTAFTTSALLAWLLASSQSKPRTWTWPLAGALLVLVYLSQPLWVPGLLPLLLVALVAQRRVGPALGLLAGASVVFAGARLASASATGAWAGPPFEVLSYVVALREMVAQVFTTLTGSYYLWWAITPPGPVTVATTWFWYAAIPLTVVVQAYRLISGRRHTLSHLLFASMWTTLAAQWLLLGARDPRYMLPTAVPLALLVCVEGADLLDRLAPRTRVATVCAALLVALGCGSMLEFSRFAFLWPNPAGSLSEAARLRQVVRYLNAHGIHHVYVANGLLQWQLMFYSNGTLVARSFDPVDRQPALPREVDAALVAGAPVAVVGFTDTSGAPGCGGTPPCAMDLAQRVPDPERLFVVDGKYVVYAGANRALVEALRFRVWE